MGIGLFFRRRADRKRRAEIAGTRDGEDSEGAGIGEERAGEERRLVRAAEAAVQGQQRGAMSDIAAFDLAGARGDREGEGDTHRGAGEGQAFVRYVYTSFFATAKLQIVFLAFIRM